MTNFIILVLTIAALSYFRFWIQQRLMGLVLLLGGSKKLAIWLYSLLFFPGTMLHELSHFFTAAILAVPTGEISILPDLEEGEGGEQRMGSVAVAKTDFFRSSLIGAAPFLIGSFALYAIIQLNFTSLLEAADGALTTIQALIDHAYLLREPLTYLWLYLIIAISNTMFLSKADRRAWPVLAILVLLLGVASYLTGIDQQLITAVKPVAQNIITALSSSFTFVVVLDILIVGILFALELILQRITGKTIKYSKS